MKKYLVLIITIISILSFGCSKSLYVQQKENKLITKLYAITDTIYSLSTNDSKNKITIVWYHHNNKIYSFLIEPYKTIKYKPVAAKNINVEERIELYFEISMDKNVECFENRLDGDFIQMYIKNRKTLYSGIYRPCLFTKTYKQGSFPFKLQYDLSKIYKPVDYQFEKMYPNLE